MRASPQVLVKVASIGLDPHRHLNVPLAALRPLLAKLHAQFGVHECGEGGEYESLALDCPLFVRKLVLDEVCVGVGATNSSHRAVLSHYFYFLFF